MSSQSDSEGDVLIRQTWCLKCQARSKYEIEEVEFDGKYYYGVGKCGTCQCGVKRRLKMSILKEITADDSSSD